MTRNIIGLILVILGVAVMLLAVYGTFRFKYVLNRMHSSAMGDTLGLLLVLAGLMVMSGVSALSFKMLAIIIFMWLASPVMSHLIARAEVLTHAHLKDECEVIRHEDRI